MEELVELVPVVGGEVDVEVEVEVVEEPDPPELPQAASAAPAPDAAHANTSAIMSRRIRGL